VTVLVGIRCKGGVVVGSDSAATFGANGQSTIGQQSVAKVTIIQDRIAYAGTGAVGIAQLIIDSISRGWSEKAFSGAKTPEQMMNLVGERIGKLVTPYFQTAQLQRGITGEASATLCKSLIAMPVNKEFHLFQFDFGGAPEHATKQLPFVALGGGQLIADPFLAMLKRLLWPECEPTLAEGRLAAVWTIDHVRRTTPGGVGGAIQLATLTDAGETVKLATNDDVDEHLQAVENALAALVQHIKGMSAGESTVAPPQF
jgi:20S proteasome alpha/beta subunit